jgi:hypothetical protein
MNTGTSGAAVQEISWFNWTVTLPFTLALIAMDPPKININIELGLALKGNMSEMFRGQSIRAIAHMKGQPSVRALMKMLEGG